MKHKNYAGIINAIQNKTNLLITYDGLPRMIEPYAWGISTTKKHLLHAYQSQGFSPTSLGWKFFEIDKIEDICVLNKRGFEVRKGYTPINLNIIAMV